MIFILAGLPGAGKTYLAVSMAIDKWKKNPSHRIYSNFPIRWKNISSYKWKPEYIAEDLFNSTIVIDESYRDFNSRKWGSFSDDAHLALATSRHNNNDFYLIAQSVQRIDTVIREIANEIFVVHKRCFPGIERPLWFYVETFDGIEALKMRAISKQAVYRKFRKRFSMNIANCYDTLQYRKDTDKVFIGEPWYDIKPEKRKFDVKVLARRFRGYGLLVLRWRPSGSGTRILPQINFFKRLSRPGTNLFERRTLKHLFLFYNCKFWNFILHKRRVLKDGYCNTDKRFVQNEKSAKVG